MDLSFRSISCSVQVAAKKAADGAGGSKTILDAISGQCKAGALTAIMGPSGAGKTTLLDILAGRKVGSSGLVALGDKRDMAPAELTRCSAYVQQDDAIMASQTVREAVVMSALLCLPRGMAYKEKVARAEEVLCTFHLEGCADTLVGDPVGRMKGVSGGERKRCAVAMMAVRRPQLFFLDEPTSGLDAYKAYVLMDVLKAMAHSSKATVVCTIHQPSSDIFALLDGLQLLLDGRTVWAGPAGEAVHHFAAQGFSCPQFANPADFFFMHVLSSADGASAEQARRAKLAEGWAESQAQKDLDRQLGEAFGGNDATPASTGTRRTEVDAMMASRSGASWCLQFRVLLWRSFNDLRRNKMRGKVAIGQSIVFAIIMALIWWQVTDDQNGVQDRAGALFFMSANGMMFNIISVLNGFANERNAVLREQENNLYHSLPYFASRVIVDIPIKVIQSSLFGSIAYFTLGFQLEVDRYLLCIATLVLLAQASNAIGLCLACIFPDIQIALAIAPLVTLPLMMFSGFFLNPESTPVYLIWLEWLSPMKYAFAALVQNEFTGLSLICTPQQMRNLKTADGTAVQVCPIPNGEAFIESLNIQDVLTIPVCLLCLVAMAVGFLVLAYMGLVLVIRLTVAKSRAPAPSASKSQ